MTQEIISDRTVARLVGGRYRISGLVASGGMGEVYAARDTVLDRTVALKVLRPNLGSDPGFVERFRGEATNAARLSHPSIVQVYDWGRDEHDTFMAMEFVDGQNLREVLASEGTLSPEVAARIAWQVCSALEHARRAGIVHRDIKPENILITPEGSVKVADFGLARALAESRATQAGIVLGTAAYLSPEQVQGGEVDQRADIYALGIVLYEMLTGVTPFTADSPAAVAYRRIHEDVPAPSARVAGLPRALDTVVATATARDPGGRYISPAEMGAALRAAVPDAAFTGGLGIEVHQTTAIPVASQETVQIAIRKGGHRWRKRRVAALIAILTLILGVLVPVGLRANAKAIVPSVTRLSQEKAAAALRKAGFDTTTVTRNDPRIPSGSVITTQPPAGTKVKKGSTVTLFVSLGPVLVTVPDVVGKTASDAIAALKHDGLVPVRRDVFNAAKKDTVVGQEPRNPAVIAKGAKVTVTVSKGPEPVLVPDVKSKLQAEATSVLTTAGFTVKVTQKEDPNVPEGTVISQTPAAGTKAPKGSEIALVVSKGTPLAKVPDLTCMTRKQATDAATAAGFKIRFEGRNKYNIVVDQDPVPNSEAHKGSTITAVVGFGTTC
ncbi:MAG: PASTA domain-containing protein [Actinomycetota bacterium]